MPAAEIARILEERRADVALYVGLDTLEYLRKGGRISAAQAHAQQGKHQGHPAAHRRDRHGDQPDHQQGGEMGHEGLPGPIQAGRLVGERSGHTSGAKMAGM